MSKLPPPTANDPFGSSDLSDDEGWQDMPVVREDDFTGLDEEDKKRYHYVSSTSSNTKSNATGNLIDFDDKGQEWRAKLDSDESSYTRLRGTEEDDNDEVHLRTKYLFDEDKAMTPLSQMQATKNLLTEAQRIAYVGVCALISREMLRDLQVTKKKELKGAAADMELWMLKIMGRLYYHMELETQEQKMIESLAEHGVQASDLVPALMTTHTVANPEYDPEEGRRRAEEDAEEERIRQAEQAQQLSAQLKFEEDKTKAEQSHKAKAQAMEFTRDPFSFDDDGDDLSISETLVGEEGDGDLSNSNSNSKGDITPKASPKRSPATLSPNPTPSHTRSSSIAIPRNSSPNPNPNLLDPAQQPQAPPISNPAQTTTSVLPSTTTSIPGVSTSLSPSDSLVTLDIRWTVLCDLFLILIADSVYDARSRVLLERLAMKLGLGWLDLVRFEARVTEALEIQEDVEKLDQEAAVDGAKKSLRKRRIVMLGLATLGGGLVIGLSAGLLAPVIGAGLAGALTTVGVTGTGAFLGGTAGAAVITTGGVLTGSGIAVKGMAKRTQYVRTFDILPLHNNKRVSCILTVPGFMTGINDDPRLPFSVLDPVVGDVFSVLWEPEMIRETGSALKILTGEVLSQIGLTVLQATAMTTLMSALQWPIILTKLGYLIDNPWSNALDRAKSAGRVLADVLIQRHLGVRPITLIGFSLGARVIFYALLELAKNKHYGIVQDVFLLGATLTVSNSMWLETRSVVSGRYVNGFARNDWVLNYLFRATSGGVGTVAGLRPIEGVPGLENVDVTDKIAGHMSYRTFMPLILDQLGFPVFSDFFDEPEEPDFTEERIVVREEDKKEKKGWFSRRKSSNPPKSGYVSRPPTASTFQRASTPRTSGDDHDLPPRMGSMPTTPTRATSEVKEVKNDSSTTLPLHAGFDLNKIKEVVGDVDPKDAKVPAAVAAAAAAATATTVPSRVEAAAGPTRAQSTPPGGGLETRMASVSLDEERSPYLSTRSTQSTSSISTAASFDRSPKVPMAFDDDDVEPPSWGAPSSSRAGAGYSSFSERDEGFSSFATPSASGFSGFSPPPVSGGFSPLSSNPFAASTASFSSFPSDASAFKPAAAAPALDNPFASPGARNPLDNPLSRNPFGASQGGGMVFGSESGLSFGSADGSITVLPSPPVADPWAAPSDFGKKGFGSAANSNSNPWS